MGCLNSSRQFLLNLSCSFNLMWHRTTVLWTKESAGANIQDGSHTLQAVDAPVVWEISWGCRVEHLQMIFPRDLSFSKHSDGLWKGAFPETWPELQELFTWVSNHLVLPPPTFPPSICPCVSLTCALSLSLPHSLALSLSCHSPGPFVPR